MFVWSFVYSVRSMQKGRITELDEVKNNLCNYWEWEVFYYDELNVDLTDCQQYGTVLEILIYIQPPSPTKKDSSDACLT